MANDWPLGAILAEQKELFQTLGEAQVRVIVPTAKALATFAKLDLDEVDSSTSYVTFYMSDDETVPPEEEVTTPVMYRYRTSDATTLGTPIEGVPPVEFTASSEGAYFGVVSLQESRSTMTSFQDWWHLDNLATIDGQPIVIPAITIMFRQVYEAAEDLAEQAAPAMEVDQPMAAAAAAEKPKHYFMEIGEMKWCTKNGSNSAWKPILSSMGGDTQYAFADSNINVQAVFAVGTCWVASSQTAANNCASGSTTCKDSDCHVYPFNGDGKDAYKYRSHVASAITEIKRHQTFTAVKLGQVVHDGTMTFGSDTVCGVGTVWTSTTSEPLGASVTLASNNVCNNGKYTWTHELAHNYAALHDRTTTLGGCWTIMQDQGGSACYTRLFSSTSRTQMNNCIANSACPRSGTF